MSFAIGDVAAGAWRSYLVGIVGEVTLDEDDMQWPNQVRAVHSTPSEQHRWNFGSEAQHLPLKQHKRKRDGGLWCPGGTTIASRGIDVK